MIKSINLPDGVVANFPADMSNEAIEAVLVKQFPKKSPLMRTVSSLGKGLHETVGAVGEPLLKMATGAIAKPVSDIAGMVSGAADVVSGGKLGGRNAREVQQDVQSALTYAPRTAAGASEFNPLNAIPEAIGQGMGAVAEAGAGVVGDVLPGDAQDPFSLAGMGANATREAIPHVAGIAGAKYLPQATANVGRKLQGGSEKIMRSALGPNLAAVASGEAQAAAKTLLREGVSPNVKGAAKLRVLHETAQRLTDDTIARANKGTMGGPGVRSSPAPKVPAQGVVDSLENYSTQLNKQVDSMADVAAVTQLTDRFLMHPDVINGNISLPAAHAMQRGTTAKLASDRGTRMPTVLAEGQRLSAEALRKGIADRVPDAGTMFAREAELANALTAAERRAFTELTKNPVDIGLYIRNNTARAAYLANKSSPFKAFFAKYLNKAGQAMETAGTAAETLFSGAP